MTKRFRRHAPAFLLAVFGFSGLGSHAADGVTPVGPIVELPKFEVTDSRLLPPPESWRYAELPGFEVLSNISERETKRFVRDFMLLQEVIGVIMPGITQGQTPVPTALLLCGRGKGFEEFLPAERANDRYNTNSLFFRNTERSAIVVDFALSELQLDAATTQEADPYRGFYLEYYRFLLRRQLSQLPPPWFEEGLVQLLAATDFNKKWITFAQIGDGFGGEKIGDFNRMLSQRALLPFPELFAEIPRERSAFWSAQSYAFVHLCLYGMNKKYQRPFLKFVDRISHEPLSEELFKECFNKSYKQMGLELRGYLDFTNYTAQQFRAKKGQELPEPPVVPLHTATDADVGRIKGEVLRLGGHGVEAHNALVAPYVRGERDPRLLAALGLDERIAGHDERAVKFLEAAAAQKVSRPRAYLELARLRYEAAIAKSDAGAGKLNSKQVSSVLEPLFIALKQPPPMAEVYALIAETWSHSAVPPKRDNFDVIFEGVKLFPRDSSLLMQAALLCADQGLTAEARAIADLGARTAASPGDKERFTVFGDALRRDATSSPDPTPAAPKLPEPFSK